MRLHRVQAITRDQDVALEAPDPNSPIHQNGDESRSHLRSHCVRLGALKKYLIALLVGIAATALFVVLAGFGGGACHCSTPLRVVAFQM